MKKLFVIGCLAFLSIAGTVQAQALPTSGEVDAARQCLAPWLLGADDIYRRFPDTDAKFYREILRNSPIAIPVVVRGQQAARVLTEPVDMRVPYVTVLAVCPGTNAPEWADTQNLIGIYRGDPYNAIILRSDVAAPQLVRGLILFHEMRHAFQNATKDKRARIFLEKDAYEYEFALLDGINLPGYESFLASEVTRIRAQIAAQKSATAPTNDPRIPAMFGPLDDTSRRIVETELFLRTLFKVYDLEPTKEQASMHKLQMLASIGY